MSIRFAKYFKNITHQRASVTQFYQRMNTEKSRPFHPLYIMMERPNESLEMSTVMIYARYILKMRIILFVFCSFLSNHIRIKILIDIYFFFPIIMQIRQSNFPVHTKNILQRKMIILSFCIIMR